MLIFPGEDSIKGNLDIGYLLALICHSHSKPVSKSSSFIYLQDYTQMNLIKKSMFFSLKGEKVKKAEIFFTYEILF